MSVLALTAANAVRAQELSEVVVTATKAGATNLQKTPLSISVVGGDELDQSRVVTLRDLPSAVPALKVTQNSINTVVYIRGVGGYPSNNEADVSIYMDGVYLGRNSIALQTNFNDLDRVEVVKGPQGTLFGRNAVGGALNFISKRPSKTLTYENTLSLGNYALVDDAFSISGPLTDKAQASLAVGYVKHDGYLDNVVPGMPDIYAANRRNVRAQFQYEPTDKITNLIRVDYVFTDEDNTSTQNLLIRTDDPRNITCSTTTLVCAYSGFSAPLANSTVGDYSKIASGITPHVKELAYGVNDELNWQINDHFSIRNLLAYRTDLSKNFSNTNGTEFVANATQSNYYEHQISDELTLQQNLGGLSGVAGLYYYKDYQRQVADQINAGGNPQRPGAGAESFQDTRYPTTSSAVFFSETYHFTPDLGVTLGARYTHEKKVLDTLNTSYVWTGTYFNGKRGATSASSGGPDPRSLVVFPFIQGYGSTDPAHQPLTQSYNAFTPKLGIEWQATQDVFLYASATKGFKSGGFAITARNIFGASFEPEKITSYEIGAKTDWLDRRLRVNLSIFRNDWTDLQVPISVSIPGVATPVSASSNAAAARITGYDLDVIARPWEGMTLTASGSFLPEAKYLKFDTGQVAGFIKNLLIQSKDPREKGLNTQNTYDASGNRLVSTPKTSLNFSAQQNFNMAGGSVYVRGEYEYTSDVFFDISNHPVSDRPEYSLVHAAIGYIPAGGHWEVSLWGRNLADKQYATSISIGNLPIFSPGAPRTFGLRFNYKY